jgi:hypothetical protein
MSLLQAIRSAMSRNDSAQETCFSCAHFCNEPARVEVELPGLATFSSAHASVRAQDGLCLEHDLVINGRRRCAHFSSAC